jgi:hypothetical protein
LLLQVQSGLLKRRVRKKPGIELKRAGDSGRARGISGSGVNPKYIDDISFRCGGSGYWQAAAKAAGPDSHVLHRYKYAQFGL